LRRAARRNGRDDICIHYDGGRVAADLGRENIGSQIAFVTDDRKDDGGNFDGVFGRPGRAVLENCV